jgi:hypothetical protein
LYLFEAYKLRRRTTKLSKEDKTFPIQKVRTVNSWCKTPMSTMSSQWFAMENQIYASVEEEETDTLIRSIPRHKLTIQRYY